MTYNEVMEKKMFGYLDHSMQDLVKVSVRLLEREEELEREFHDYSFLVFPMAKAYEGFIKKVFLDTGMIDENQYRSKHFRVGKSLNPDLPNRYRDEGWVYGSFDELCKRLGADDLALSMWKEWKESRNLLFHYWPNHENFISFEHAKKKLHDLVEIMEDVMSRGITSYRS